MYLYKMKGKNKKTHRRRKKSMKGGFPLSSKASMLVFALSLISVLITKIIEYVPAIPQSMVLERQSQAFQDLTIGSANLAFDEYNEINRQSSVIAQRALETTFRINTDTIQLFRNVGINLPVGDVSLTELNNMVRQIPSVATFQDSIGRISTEWVIQPAINVYYMQVNGNGLDIVNEVTKNAWGLFLLSSMLVYLLKFVYKKIFPDQATLMQGRITALENDVKALKEIILLQQQQMTNQSLQIQDSAPPRRSGRRGGAIPGVTDDAFEDYMASTMNDYLEQTRKSRSELESMLNKIDFSSFVKNEETLYGVLGITQLLNVINSTSVDGVLNNETIGSLQTILEEKLIRLNEKFKSGKFGAPNSPASVAYPYGGRRTRSRKISKRKTRKPKTRSKRYSYL